MIHGIWINNEPVDLADNPKITLEYTSNLLNEPGKLNLAHSYSIKLPRTVRNARILGLPERPANSLSLVRRYLPARYYRNGIDFLGPARAYIVKVSPDSYELALVTQTLAALQTLSESKADLNSLPGLPVLRWIGTNGTTPDYNGANDADGAVFADYVSGLRSLTHPTVNAATHPSMLVSNLLERILAKAQLPYTMTPAAVEAMKDYVVLAAPSHKPSLRQEIASGSQATAVNLYTGELNKQKLNIVMEDSGWDPTFTYAASDPIATAADVAVAVSVLENDKHRVFINLKAPVNMQGASLYIEGFTIDRDYNITSRKVLSQVFFKESEDGYWYVAYDEEVTVSGWNYYGIGISYTGASRYNTDCYPIDETLPMVAVNQVHETISISGDNTFPIEGNLPEIEQWGFVKACCALFGISLNIRNDALEFRTFAELLDKSSAVDWTEKVATDSETPDSIAYTLSSWAQGNFIRYEEDVDLPFNPDAPLHIDDATLKADRDYYKLPFAASNEGQAVHYEVNGAEVKDIDIEPRIFKVYYSESIGANALDFSEDLYGSELIAKRYAELQKVIERPVVITIDVRLNEIDLKTLDLSAPVYLRQFGRFYTILKVQTSDTDLCKVELIQLP